MNIHSEVMSNFADTLDSRATLPVAFSSINVSRTSLLGESVRS